MQALVLVPVLVLEQLLLEQEPEQQGQLQQQMPHSLQPVQGSSS
jgi:hypothetical protein